MEETGRISEGTSLAVTPTWAVGTVITVMVALGFFFQSLLKEIGKWLDRTKRKALFSALDKIKEGQGTTSELMVFGLLSLLMGHWIAFVAKICVKSSALNGHFYPCAAGDDLQSGVHIFVPFSNDTKNAVARNYTAQHQYCPEESLEQLHRLIFVLGVTHISYSFFAISLAMIKIYSWRYWENQAKSIAAQHVQDSHEAALHYKRMQRLPSFIFNRTSHPWSQHRLLVWLYSFSRQFWGSITEPDYMALRFGFVTTHQLPLTYDFHKYMLRSMDEEFRDIVGISVPLWVYAISCIFLDFHGTDVYFWLSFIPAILILLIGTKLHRVVVKLAVEITDGRGTVGNYRFNLRDDLFWFGKPRILLLLIQFISFQNAFEMSTFLWSLWEIKDSACFMDNRRFVLIRLIFGVVSQFWCSFITFPLYVIVTQMGAKFKRTIVSDHVWISLQRWQKRVKTKSSSSTSLLGETSTSILSSKRSSGSKSSDSGSSEESSSRIMETRNDNVHLEASTTREMSYTSELLDVALSSSPCYSSGSSVDHDDHTSDNDVVKDNARLI